MQNKQMLNLHSTLKNLSRQALVRISNKRFIHRILPLLIKGKIAIKSIKNLHCHINSHLLIFTRSCNFSIITIYSKTSLNHNYQSKDKICPIKKNKKWTFLHQNKKIIQKFMIFPSKQIRQSIMYHKFLPKRIW